MCNRYLHIHTPAGVVCMYLLHISGCMYVCIYLHARTHTQTHTHKSETRTHRRTTHTYTQKHTNTHTNTQIHTHTHMHTHTHTATRNAEESRCFLFTQVCERAEREIDFNRHFFHIIRNHSITRSKASLTCTGSTSPHL
jgi:hypothetical protein